MKDILPTYEITKSTYGLFPAKGIEYDTIVLEEDGLKYVRETSFNLIKKACFASWSDYNGKRNAVIHNLNYRRRTPIPVNEREGLYFFPTHGVTHMDNAWIALEHILQIKKGKRNDKAAGMLVFHNRQSIILPVSTHTLQTQWERTFTLKYQIEKGPWMRKNG